MNLRERIDAAWYSGALMLGALPLFLWGLSGMGFAIAISAFVVATRRHTWPRIGSLLAWRTLKRLGEHIAAGDEEAARAALLDARTIGLTPEDTALLDLLEATLRLLEHRWDDARALIDGVDVGRLAPWAHETHAGVLAWALAHTGEAERAVEVARSLVERTSSGDAEAEVRDGAITTLGMALVMAGEHAEAAQWLARPSSASTEPRRLASRHYFLGEALVVLGRDDEARSAFTAATEADRTRFADKAREALVRKLPPPYR